MGGLSISLCHQTENEHSFLIFTPTLDLELFVFLRTLLDIFHFKICLQHFFTLLHYSNVTVVFPFLHSIIFILTVYFSSVFLNESILYRVLTSLWCPPLIKQLLTSRILCIILLLIIILKNNFLPLCF